MGSISILGSITDYFLVLFYFFFQEIKELKLKKENELKKLCDHHRSKKGNYDCIVPGSGGKDSTFTAHILISFGLAT